MMTSHHSGASIFHDTRFLIPQMIVQVMMTMRPNIHIYTWYTASTACLPTTLLLSIPSSIP
jgi:hypothetical protein